MFICKICIYLLKKKIKELSKVVPSEWDRDSTRPRWAACRRWGSGKTWTPSRRRRAASRKPTPSVRRRRSKSRRQSRRFSFRMFTNTSKDMPLRHRLDQDHLQHCSRPIWRSANLVRSIPDLQINSQSTEIRLIPDLQILFETHSAIRPALAGRQILSRRLNTCGVFRFHH